MTTKDLNLSLDKRLLEQGRSRAAEPRNEDIPSLQSISALSGEELAGPASGKPGATAEQTVTDNTAPSPNQAERRQWIVTTGIALANMLFLVLAGLWLTWNDYEARSPFALRSPDETTQIAPALNQLQPTLSGLQEQLNTLQQQLTDMRATAEQQQQVIVATQQKIQEQIDEFLANQELENEPAANETTLAKTADWHINVGTYNNEAGALSQQQQITARGYPAHVITRVAEGATTFEVIIPGFGNRELAELTAKQIMEQTNLNGLWVGNSE